MMPLVSDLANDVVSRIRNEQVAGSVNRHARGPIHFRIGRRAPVAGVASNVDSGTVTVACHRCNDAVGEVGSNSVAIGK